MDCRSRVGAFEGMKLTKRRPHAASEEGGKTHCALRKKKLKGRKVSPMAGPGRGKWREKSRGPLLGGKRGFTL